MAIIIRKPKQLPTHGITETQKTKYKQLQKTIIKLIMPDMPFKIKIETE